MSLGCGTPGGNITSDNISPMHLLNVKRLAYERRPINRQEGVEATRSPVLQASHEPAGAFAASLPSATQDEISHIVERFVAARARRSEEHTSELQSPCNLVCRLLLEKKKKNSYIYNH